MKKRSWIWPVGVLIVLVVIIAVFIAATAVFDPNSNPAYKAAGDFVRAAFANDDATAFSLLNENLQNYVTANCPDGSVAACVHSYIPAEWGEVQGITFRRAAPNGRWWDVEWIASFAQDVGASGVCIFTRVEPTGVEEWRVIEWAGFIHCGDPASRNMSTNPDTPNRAP